MAWFDAERRCVAAARGWHEAVWDLTWSVETFLRRRCPAAERSAAWQVCIEVVEPSSAWGYVTQRSQDRDD